jgi:hypothetical protein
LDQKSQNGIRKDNTIVRTVFLCLSFVAWRQLRDRCFEAGKKSQTASMGEGREWLQYCADAVKAFTAIFFGARKWRKT